MTADRTGQDDGAEGAHHRAALESEQQRLADLRRSMGGDVLGETDARDQERSTADQHPAESATELEDRERDQALLEQLGQQLREVDDALDRLERGEYGRCEACGQPIGEARLEALPATRYCLVHQAMAERGGGTGVSGGVAGPATAR